MNVESAHPVIDVHGHLVPRELVERLVEHPGGGVSVRRHGEQYSFAIDGSPPTRVLPVRLMDLRLRTEWMDAEGIGVQVVSTWADLFGYGLDRTHAADWARTLNETLMESISGSPRFAAFASLPMQDPERAAGMITEALDLGFVGITVATRIGDMELDAPELGVFWEALDESGATVFIHPGYAPGDPRTADYGMVNAVGRPMDTTVTAARLLGAGIPERYPGARILLAHGGGAVSFIFGRLRRNHEIDPSVADPAPGVRRLYFDSVVFDPGALCHLVATSGADRVLLGSDYPFPIGDHSPTGVVDSAACLTPESRGAILGGNASSLLGVAPAGTR